LSRVIFDIETAGKDMAELDSSIQEYLMRFAETEEEREAVRDSLSFYPQTGEIVAIGMLNPDSGKGAVFFQAPPISGIKPPIEPFEEDGVRFESGTEKEILEKFWRAVKSFDQIITFNGRCFDCPFILVRSALHRVRPTRDIMPNRYSIAHVDLMDQLCFYGTTKKRFSLDIWCRTFGIKSPKEETRGHEVKDLFREGKYLDIARYCVGDLKATKELFDFWQNYMRFSPEADKGEKDKNVRP
jgi:DNA polymerase elongation subunit (family B)